MYQAVLCHHGILGQRWGVRRFQNADGSYTAAGRSRYGISDGRSYEISNKSKKSSTNNTEVAKNTFKEENIDEEKKKRSRVEKLTDKYRQQGMSKEEAEKKAYKRAKIEKVVEVTAGLTLAAAGAYAARKYYINNVDRVLTPKTVLQTMTLDKDFNVNRNFYASHNPIDKLKYKGMYGHKLYSRKNLDPQKDKVFKATIGLKDNLKIASRKSVINTMNEMVKNDPSFNKEMQQLIGAAQKKFKHSNQHRMFDKALKSLEQGKIDKNVYNAFNISLWGGPETRPIRAKFYNTLKSKGYDAIQDINDVKFSGYHSHDPLILFDKGAKTKINEIKDVSREVVNIENIKALLETGLEYGGLPAGTIAAGTAFTNKTIKNFSSNDEKVNKYRNKYKTSRKSYEWIVNNSN